MATRLELFDQSAAAIFAELYENFPIPINLKPTTIAAEVFTEDDTGEDIDEKWAVIEATLAWLKQSGFIWVERYSPLEAEGVVLSPKGLEVMKIPSSLEKKSQPLGKALVEAVKKGAKDAAASAVGAALTAGVKLLVGQVVPGGGDGAP
jgi:hypothetical protein